MRRVRGMPKWVGGDMRALPFGTSVGAPLWGHKACGGCAKRGRRRHAGAAARAFGGAPFVWAMGHVTSVRKSACGGPRQGWEKRRRKKKEEEEKVERGALSLQNEDPTPPDGQETH
eukprot:1432764-Pyramimonas_sp.AAC.1